jgi:hypothetical protein
MTGNKKHFIIFFNSTSIKRPDSDLEFQCTVQRCLFTLEQLFVTDEAITVTLNFRVSAVI